MELDKLPLVLVSAADEAAAESIISDLLEGETTHPVNSQGHIVWELRNKYYTCTVIVATSRNVDFPAEPVEAHLIYLKPGEDESDAQARIRNVVADIKLVATRTAPSEALERWSAGAHYELVSLGARDAADEDEAEDAHGAARLRAALHAHSWPNLRLLPRAAAAERGSARAVEDAAQLMSLVAALGAARRDLPPARRRAALAALLPALARLDDDD